MDLSTTEILICLAVFLLSYFYYHLTSTFDFWKKRGVAGPQPIPLFGNLKDVAFGRVHIADFMKDLITAYPSEPAIGIFAKSTPILILNDPVLIKDALVKSFWSFADRGVRIYGDIDPLAEHLVYLDPERWRPMRYKLTPVFTSAKLKEMFYLVVECAEEFISYIDRVVETEETHECYDLTAKYTTDVIGVCVFGLKANAIADENSEFRQLGRESFAPSFWNNMRHRVRDFPHWLARLLKPIARNDRLIDFFVNTITGVMRHRKENGIRKNDFVDFLMDIKEEAMENGEVEMTDLLLTAQAYAFFIAGFETSSSSISTALYELALNGDIQKKLRDEINEAFQRNDGKLTYDSIKNMKYLDKVVKETLRKCPPGYMLTRKAMKDHTFFKTNISIPKGTRIFIPVYAIHRDPNIYPDPDKFDPERFDEECSNARDQMSYLPFGGGPRNCIGYRFGLIQVKVGLAYIIRNFTFEICDKTQIPYEKRIHAIILAPMSVFLKIKKL